MIICSCNFIKISEIEEVIHDFLKEDPWQLITVGMVYHAMSKRGKCCGCFPNAIALIVRAVEAWHRSRRTPVADIVPFVLKTRKALEKQDQMHRENAFQKIASKAA